MSQATDFAWPHLTGVIDRLEGQSAIIKLTTGAELSWPLADQTKQLTAGQSVTLMLLTEKSKQAERQRLAKTILNEILKPEPES